MQRCRKAWPQQDGHSDHTTDFDDCCHAGGHFLDLADPGGVEG
jgi:hypothetical protein